MSPRLRDRDKERFARGLTPAVLTLTLAPLAVARACAGSTASSGGRHLEEEINVSRKLGLTAASAVLALSLAACGGGGAGGSSSDSGSTAKPSDTTIGVSMPTKESERWIADGNNVKKQLEDKGYKVDLQYANNDIPTQQQQLDQMTT